jgi:hypothetical protein
MDKRGRRRMLLFLLLPWQAFGNVLNSLVRASCGAQQQRRVAYGAVRQNDDKEQLAQRTSHGIRKANNPHFASLVVRQPDSEKREAGAGRRVSQTRRVLVGARRVIRVRLPKNRHYHCQLWFLILPALHDQESRPLQAEVRWARTSRRHLNPAVIRPVSAIPENHRNRSL